MKFLGYVPRMFSFFGRMLSFSKRQKEAAVETGSRYNIHTSAQGFIDRDRQRIK